jgi:hypothetical protein
MTGPDALAAFVFAIFGLAGGVLSVLLGWVVFRIVQACFGEWGTNRPLGRVSCLQSEPRTGRAPGA